MSVDWEAGPPPAPRADKPIQDLIIVFGGFSPEDELLPTVRPLLPRIDGTDVQKLLATIHSDRVEPPPGHKKLVFGFRGVVGVKPVARTVLRAEVLIRENFDPYGKLIIYGYSAGGVVAMYLCKHVARSMPFYKIGGGFSQKRPGLPVRVDLLITVDAALGPASELLERTVAPCVRTNLNYYQTQPSGNVGSFGGLNSAASDANTLVFNQNLSDKRYLDLDSDQTSPITATHANADEITSHVATVAIHQALWVGQIVTKIEA